MDLSAACMHSQEDTGWAVYVGHKGTPLCTYFQRNNFESCIVYDDQGIIKLKKRVSILRVLRFEPDEEDWKRKNVFHVLIRCQV